MRVPGEARDVRCVVPEVIERGLRVDDEVAVIVGVGVREPRPVLGLELDPRELRRSIACAAGPNAGPSS